MSVSKERSFLMREMVDIDMLLLPGNEIYCFSNNCTASFLRFDSEMCHSRWCALSSTIRWELYKIIAKNGFALDRGGKRPKQCVFSVLKNVPVVKLAGMGALLLCANLVESPEFEPEFDVYSVYIPT